MAKCYSQVGINTTNPKSTLELGRSSSSNIAEGLLTVRMTGNALAGKDNYYGTDQNATVVYVTSTPTTPTLKTSNINSPGFYYYNSVLSKWLSLSMPKFFYMPSVIFDTTVLGPKTKDLYQLYYDQFTSPAKSSAGASGKIPVLGKNDLEYYITYYDTNLFSNVSIDANGLLSYTVNSNASETSLMNIVFVVR
ncbi:hypothetical protein [Chryseobacterium candidae]|uniref:Uncharacterized protein n=1 Tax=Chryseobacterium candidae TaxID=1978493 RepID=A0ABY2R9E2_9FLAO|nr:hypothetical protein [Chryseobacterium candidae]THV59377.1 hypothetical protein EK417_11140 [Chryseobacterium candidae]